MFRCSAGRIADRGRAFRRGRAAGWAELAAWRLVVGGEGGARALASRVWGFMPDSVGSRERAVSGRLGGACRHGGFGAGAGGGGPRMGGRFSLLAGRRRSPGAGLMDGFEFMRRLPEVRTSGPCSVGPICQKKQRG